MTLFAIILTKNEAKHIAECIASVRWADGVLVSDSFSDDDTPDLARAAGAKPQPWAQTGPSSSTPTSGPRRSWRPRSAR